MRWQLRYFSFIMFHIDFMIFDSQQVWSQYVTLAWDGASLMTQSLEISHMDPAPGRQRFDQTGPFSVEDAAENNYSPTPQLPNSFFGLRLH